MKTIYTLLASMSFISLAQGQNLIGNPRFDTEHNYTTRGSNSNENHEELENYWDFMWLWQPPREDPQTIFEHVGSADVYQDTYHSANSSVYIGGLEFIVGEIEPTMETNGLYYFEVFVQDNNLNDETMRVSFTTERPTQRASTEDISFSGSHLDFSPQRIAGSEFNGWYKASKLIVNHVPYDRIVIGSVGEGGNEANVSRFAHVIDDLKLIHLGPGGLCPQTREIQNITYSDEIITYKASETIVAGSDVATYTSYGPVTVTGTSEITYRAGHEIQLLDGFGVEAGGTFHAFIAPCECDDPVAEAGPSIEICDIIQAGGTIQIGGTPMDSTTYVWSSYPEDGLAFISDPTAANPQFTPQAFGAYTFTVTATNVCQEVSTDDVTLAYILNADDTPNLDVDFNLSESTFLATLQITPDPSAYEIIVQDWISNGTVLGAEWLLTVSQDFESGQPFDFTMPALINGCDGHRVKVKLRNICSSEWVTVQEYFPQTQDPPVFTLTTDVISPNGDGINDQMCFAVSSGLAYDVLIFDRDGLLVYSASDLISSMPVCTWDGTCNETCTGEALTAGTYYQLILVMGCDENPVAFGGDIFLTNSPSGRMADPNLPIDEVRSEAIRSNSQSTLPPLYPNPTTGLITYNATAPLTSASIMDLTGRALHTANLSGVEGPVNIDLSPYRPGTYLLRIQYQSGKTEVHRVVRQ